MFNIIAHADELTTGDTHGHMMDGFNSNDNNVNTFIMFTLLVICISLTVILITYLINKDNTSITTKKGSKRNTKRKDK